MGKSPRCRFHFWVKPRWRRSSLHRNHDSRCERKVEISGGGGRGDITNGDGQQEEPKVGGTNAGVYNKEDKKEIPVQVRGAGIGIYF